MTEEQKKELLDRYAKGGYLNDILRDMRIYESSYRRACKKDPSLSKRIMEIKNSRRRTYGVVKIDEEAFLRGFEFIGGVAGGCDEAGIGAFTYYRYRKQHPEFAEKVAMLSNRMRIESAMPKRVYRVMSNGWTPPNQDLIEYPRWR